MGIGRALKIVVLAATALSAAAPAAAFADGLPVPGGLDTTSQGVLNTSGAQRFVAVAKGDSTLVMRIATGTGQLLTHRWIRGSWSVPGVAIDGDTAGISHDGSALVLIRPRVGFPQRETSLAVLDPTSLEVRREIDLAGDFSFDAISPDGTTAFVVQYPDPRDRTNYRLRTLDLRSGTLAPGSLLPENDADEEMRGLPLARATGPEGRWEFTLYDGGRLYGGVGPGKPGEPFVHAIDTVERRTLCIDLEWHLGPRTLDRLQLQLSDSGESIEVVDPGVAILGTIDIATGEATQAVAAEASEEAEEGGLPAGAMLVAAGLAGGTCVAFLIRRGRRTGTRDAGDVGGRDPMA